MKPITQEGNKRTIIVNYSLAIIFICIGVYTKQQWWYVVAAVFLGLGIIRKYWLMKRLK